MNFKSSLLIFSVLVSITASCSSGGKNDAVGSKEVVFAEKQTSADSREVFIDDSVLNSKGGSVSTSENSSQEVVKVLDDNSKIITMNDGYGNKTQTRTFSNAEHLSSIIVRTSAAGQKQAFVYGRDGTVKILPENLLDVALTAPAGKLASETGINGGKIQKLKPVEAASNKPLNPLPSSQFSVNPQPVQPSQSNQNESPAPDQAQTTSNSPVTQAKNEKQNDLPPQPPNY